MTVWYVRPTNGNDASAGTSFGTALKTTQAVLNKTLAGGDDIRLCAESVELVTGELSLGTNSGALGNSIRIRGMDGIDGTTPAIYTIRASAATGGDLLAVNTVDYYTYEDIVFDANSNAAYAMDNQSGGALSHVWIRCSFINGNSGGARSASISTAGQWFFNKCHAYGNSGDGIAGVSTSGIWQIIGGSYHDNTGDGIQIQDTQTSVSFAECYDNGGNGINLQFAANDNTRLDHCTCYGNTGSGINIHSASEAQIIINCSLVSNGAYGIAKTGGGAPEDGYYDYNHFYDNTSGTYQSTPVRGTTNDVTGDPKFVSVVNGSENFRPMSGSPLLGAGMNGMEIGARKGVYTRVTAA